MSAWTDAVTALAPYGWWKLNEASGSAAADASGNAHPGSISSATTYGVASLIPGDTGTAILFNTTSGYMTVNGLSYSSLGATYAQTFKSATDQTGAMFRSTGTSNNLAIGATSVQAIIGSGTGSVSVTFPSYDPTSLFDGNAHLIVWVVRTTTTELWVDDIMVSSVAHAAAGATLTSIQNHQSFAGPTGTYDDMVLWTSALSSAQIASLQTGWSGSLPGTVIAAGQATETDAALTATAKVGTTRTTGLATEADQALPATANVGTRVTAGQAQETDVALGASVELIAPITVTAGLAVETDEALPAAARVGLVATAGQAAEVDAALPATAILAAAPAVPAGTVTTRREGGRTRDGLATATWEPAVVQPPGVMASSEHRRIRAAAFGPVAMNGPQPVYAISQATAPRLRTRILVGGKDVSFLNGIPTPEPEWQLAEPLLWGASSIDLPQIPFAFFDPADYPWLAKGKPVVYQRVASDGTKVGRDYRGVIVNWGPGDKQRLRLEVGGHALGRAALRRKPMPLFRDTLDLGRLAWAAVRDLGLKFEPRLGPTTGIKQALFGGMDHLAYISDLCAKAFDRDGQWSLMPDEGGVYRFARKDTTTVHWTLFNDDTRVVADLRSDAAEEPNRIFASGTTPKGQRVRFGVYPGLKPGDAPPYPFNDGRTFGLGTEDAETDTGDGVFVMIRKMWTAGYLSLEDATGTYDQDVTRALMSLQEDAGLNPSGNMNPDTWSALFDLGVTGYTLRGSRIEPAAQDYRVRRYNRSASGQVIGRNPNFDPHRLIVDREIDFGAGLTRHRMREFSRAEVYRGEDNWVGTITITTGAILRGNIAPGATITEDDLADVRDIRPGQNVRLPLFAGGILVHISGVEITRTESGHPVARLTVDTQARDAMPVWEIIRRNKETRKDPARRWTGNRASSQVKDSVTEWDEIGGVLYGDVNLRAGWNVVPVVAGQEGTVSRLRLIVQDLETSGGDVAISGREFACAVFGRSVTPKRLRTLIGNPLAASPDSTAAPDPAEIDPKPSDPEDPAGLYSDPANSTPAVRPWWERKENVGPLRDLDLLYSAGTREDPCGYGEGRKSKGATRTGVHRTDAGFSYRTRREPVLYLAVWVWGERTLSGGRVMWPQLEAGA